jgi:putative holliday junction resolvase
MNSELETRNAEAPLGRVLGIDYGEARVGVARSDELGWFAHPLETIETVRVEPVKRICELVRQLGAGTVVLGMPYRMDGSAGPAVEKVREFRKRLEEALGGSARIVETDERWSTVSAQRQLRTAGFDSRQSRPVIDQAAAAVILQAYLDRCQAEAGESMDDEDSGF